MPSLTWIGREAVERHHSAVPFHLLHADPLRSAGDAGSGNLLVEGDNLVALKALLPYYAGQVKCIYIDPPYNTGKQTWSYNDDVSSPVIQEWLKQTLAGHPIDESDLTRHDKWLCMMYPRLVLLRQLLKPDGVIWISIDGTELANLLLLLDEIFYPQNRIGVIVWKNATDNNPTRISIEHEYILCYARDIRMVASVWKEREPLAKRRMLDKYTELHKKHSDVAQIQKEFRKFVRENADELQPLTHYTRVDEHGPYTGSRKVHNPGKDGYHFDVIHPVTGGVCVEPARGYRFPESTYLRLREDGKILFGDDHTQIIQIKEYLADFEGSLKSVINLDGRTGANALQALFGNRTTFRNPKSVEIVQTLLSFTTGKDDLILDSFAGSGTTGHAVMELNQSDGGQRRFILIEMEPSISREVTARRIEKYSRKNSVGGFQYCTLGQTLFDAAGRIRPEVSFAELARFVYFHATGGALAQEAAVTSPLLGVHHDTAVYLLYNGILKDKSAGGGNALTRQVLAGLPAHAGPKLIYGVRSLLGADRLRREGVTFRHIPTDLQL